VENILYSGIMMRILVVIFLFFAGSVSAQSPVVPDFSLTRMDNGKPYQRKDMVTNKPTLFLFLDAECSHCQDALTQYNTHYKELGSVAVYLVSMNKKESVVPFLAKFGKDISHMKNATVLLDNKYEFVTKFKPIQYPGMFLYSSSQRLEMYSHENKDIPVILAKISPVKPQ
jgi:peroxiredoxin